MCVTILRRVPIVCLVLLFIAAAYGQANTPSLENPREDNWAKLVGLAEALLGDEGVLAAKDPEQRINAIVDLHAEYCELVGKTPLPFQRVLIVKQGLRMFIRTAAARYSGDKRQALLRFIKDLATNRAVFSEFLTSDTPAEVIEAQLMAYLEHNEALSYKDPVAIKGQFSAILVQVPGTLVAPLMIESEQVRLIADQGASGHYNRAVDAGETITLNIPLKNVGDKPFRSTSAFILTDDEFILTDSSEVVYTQRQVVAGDTVTFGPGVTIVPKQHFTFTVLPTCPDGHMAKFKLLVWDSDQGKFDIPFEIRVYHVGPLDFGEVLVDDDIPGPSNGNNSGIMEPGEVIEYTVPIKNTGKVAVQDVTALLFSSEPAIQFKAGEDTLKYKDAPAESERPIAASFVFAVDKNPANVPSSVVLKMLVQGAARGFQYSWVKARSHRFGAMSVASHCPARCWLVGYARPARLMQTPILKSLATVEQLPLKGNIATLQPVTELLVAYGGKIGETGEPQGGDEDEMLFILRTGNVKALLGLLNVGELRETKDHDDASFGRSYEGAPWIHGGADRIVVAGSAILEETSMKPRQDSVLQRFPRVGWVPLNDRELLAFALARWPEENGRAFQNALREELLEEVNTTPDTDGHVENILGRTVLAVLPAKEACLRLHAETEGMALSLVAAFATEEAASSASRALAGYQRKAVAVMLGKAPLTASPGQPSGRAATTQSTAEQTTLTPLAGLLGTVLETAGIRAEAECVFIDLLVTPAQVDAICKAIRER